MSKINSRTKGASAEREVIKLLEDVVRENGGGMLKRNLEQWRSGGHDVIGLDWLAIEIKRCETLLIETWWSQTLEQAARTGGEPVLIYRQSRKPWSVIMWGRVGDLKMRVQISFEDFKLWLAVELQNRQGYVMVSIPKTN